MTAYRELKIQRVHTAEGSTEHWAIGSLGELADVLRSISHQERSPRPRQEV